MKIVEQDNGLLNLYYADVPKGETIAEAMMTSKTIMDFIVLRDVVEQQERLKTMVEKILKINNLKDEKNN